MVCLKNKHSILFRYNPEVGDLVVGRITEVILLDIVPKTQIDLI